MYATATKLAKGESVEEGVKRNILYREIGKRLARGQDIDKIKKYYKDIDNKYPGHIEKIVQALKDRNEIPFKVKEEKKNCGCNQDPCITYGQEVKEYSFSKREFLDNEAENLHSENAVELAKKHNTRLHILHISTDKETNLFRNDIPLNQKRITAEACVHHLWFDESSYDEKGTWIKWNPAVKSAKDKDGVWRALIDDRIDVIATDHAPHTLDEKNNTYFKAPSGGPLVQHALVAMLEFHHQGKVSLEWIVDKMCHAPATCFQVKERGFIREGYYADLVVVDLNKPWVVDKDNILYHCGWSPFEGETFRSSVIKTFVNGNLVYDGGIFDEQHRGMRLEFDRHV